MRGLIGRAAVVAGAVVVLLGLAVGVASATGAAAGPRLAAGPRALSGGTWGTAEEIPGTAALNKGGAAQTTSVSCASAGNCGAAGQYTDSSGSRQAFVVSQVNGTWGTAKEVPGTATLNTGGFAEPYAMSCPSAGTCGAAGQYADSSGLQAFVVSQVNGTWGTAKEVPGTAALNKGGGAAIDAVSCASAGNCSAGGNYTDSSGNGQADVVSQVNGTWGTAKEVPGTAALNKGGGAQIFSVSCGSPGNCGAGGLYLDSSGRPQAFVVSQVHGTWGTAKEVAAALNTGRSAAANSVSCASAGNCSAGGQYADSSFHIQAFVVSQVNGTWGTAKEVPGTAALNKGGAAYINGVSCASAGNCSAAGTYKDSSRHTQAFVVSQVHGTWGTAKEVPGTAALNKGGNVFFGSVSCPSAGNCGAAGSYTDSSAHTQGFVVSQVNGTWGTAKEVPGLARLNIGGRVLGVGVSCGSAGNCSAGGTYKDSGGHFQVFVASQR